MNVEAPIQQHNLDVAARERLLMLFACATFVVFFQAYSVAPMLAELSISLSALPRDVGLAVPAYLIAYGVSAPFAGIVADRIGVAKVMPTSLMLFVLLVLATAFARTVESLVILRTLTGVIASGIVPLAMVMVAKLYPYQERGRPLGWIFGGMAGGMAIGSPLGVFVSPVIGWQGVMVLIAVMAACILIRLQSKQEWLSQGTNVRPMTLPMILGGYRELLSTWRGARTYGYVLLNSMFHSGVFTWLAIYLVERHGLSPMEIGVALLGYGVPGLLLAPLIGRAADRFGRARLIPAGLGLAAFAVFLLSIDISVGWFLLPVVLLSLGYDMTQPLFAGIISDVGKARVGQAMGLNVCTLFVGFGLGSLVFRQLLPFGFAVAFGWFACLQAVIALAAIRLLRDERRPDQKSIVPEGNGK